MGRVAGHPLERRVHPDQRVVGTARVRDRERDRRGDQRAGGQLVDSAVEPRRRRQRREHRPCGSDVRGAVRRGQPLPQRLLCHGGARCRVGARDGGAVGSSQGTSEGSRRAHRAHRAGGPRPVSVAVRDRYGEERDDGRTAGDAGGREQLGAGEPVGVQPVVVVGDLEAHAGYGAARGDDGHRVHHGDRLVTAAPGQDQAGGCRPVTRPGGQSGPSAREGQGGGVGIGHHTAAGVEEQDGDVGVVGRPYRAPAPPGKCPVPDGRSDGDRASRASCTSSSLSVRSLRAPSPAGALLLSYPGMHPRAGVPRRQAVASRQSQPSRPATMRRDLITVPLRLVCAKSAG